MGRRSSTKKRHREKKECQSIHFMQRVWQRFHIWITRKEVKELQEYVAKSKHKKSIILRQSHRVIGFRYQINSVRFVVLWDKKRNVPITALNEFEMFETYKSAIDENGVVNLQDYYNGELIPRGDYL